MWTIRIAKRRERGSENEHKIRMNSISQPFALFLSHSFSLDFSHWIPMTTKRYTFVLCRVSVYIHFARVSTGCDALHIYTHNFTNTPIHNKFYSHYTRHQDIAPLSLLFRLAFARTFEYFFFSCVLLRATVFLCARAPQSMCLCVCVWMSAYLFCVYVDFFHLLKTISLDHLDTSRTNNNKHLHLHSHLHFILEEQRQLRFIYTTCDFIYYRYSICTKEWKKKVMKQLESVKS